MKAWITFAASALLLAGCSSAPAAAPTASPTPSGGDFATMADLTDAFVAAGGVCEDPAEAPKVSDYVDEARLCGFRGDLLTLYGPGGFPAEDAANLTTILTQDDTDGGAVYGRNWLILTTSADAATDLADALGADVTVHHSSKPGIAARTRLEFAAGNCDLKVGGTANFGDGGLTLTLADMLFTMQKCILDQLEVPDSVLARIGATRALDGMQTAEWGTVTATWTYHPDDGLDLILTSTD